MIEQQPFSPAVRRVGIVRTPPLLRPASTGARLAHCLTAIELHDSQLRAVVTRVTGDATDQAHRLDALDEQGRSAGSLHGLIFTLKDIIALKGTRTTNGSNFQAEIPDHDATVVTRLKSAGATIVAKTNLHEFAYGGTTQNPFWGSCRNPWDMARIPGGSSGGSAVAVAAGFCHVSLGSDTAGSGRLPAALTGISALRPTLGRISNGGVTPCSPFFDTVSPMARRVSDIALTYAAIAGYDARDPHSTDRAVDWSSSELTTQLEGVRIGVPKAKFFHEHVDAGVAAAVARAIDVLESLGATLVEIEIPRISEAAGHLEKLFHADVATVHAERLKTAPDRFGPDIRERLETLGGTVTGTAYANAAIWMTAWRRQLQTVFASVDAVVHAAAPSVAPLVAECESTTAATRRLAAFCYPWSLAGVPSLAVPCGFAEHDMPCGLAIVAPWWGEAKALRVGEAFQRATDWHLFEAPLLYQH